MTYATYLVLKSERRKVAFLMKSRCMYSTFVFTLTLFQYIYLYYIYYSFFGSSRILPLFPDLRDSPILANFTWSPLIHSALETTAAHLFSSTHTSNHIVPGVIAIHLRRGDYKRHCLRLAKWGSTYMGFNQFEGLVDSFNASSTVDEYLQHCLPTTPQIVHRLNEIRGEYSSPLTQVYIMTNAWPSYISTLSSALLADGWKSVSSTPDIDPFLSKEQRYVDVGVDMALAIDKAEVFVGNGVSFFFFFPQFFFTQVSLILFFFVCVCFSSFLV